MKAANLLPDNYSDRIEEILHNSWRVLKTRFVDGRHQFAKEAPFQHHFAHIISTIGETYCTKRDDMFLVDLETKVFPIKDKTKFIDITCSFPTQQISCAIELKFKTAKQGAQDHGRIDAFVDIEALELACQNDFDFGRFYMITNSTSYINKSKRGVGTVFTTHQGAITLEDQIFHCPLSKGREHIHVHLKNAYHFQWEQIGNWYFLDLKIVKPKPPVKDVSMTESTD